MCVLCHVERLLECPYSEVTVYVPVEASLLVLKMVILLQPQSRFTHKQQFEVFGSFLAFSVNSIRFCPLTHFGYVYLRIVSCDIPLTCELLVEL